MSTPWPVVRPRDRTCTEGGCDVPAAWCDAHHVVPWWAHGPTEPHNLELRCRFHHLEDHLRMAREAADQQGRGP